MSSTISIEVSPEEAQLHLIQRQREEEAKAYARKKARERQQQLASMGMYGDLDGSRKEVQSQLDKAIEGFEKFLEGKYHSLSKTAKLLPILKTIPKKDRETLISDALDVMLNSVDNVSLTGVVHRLGDLVEVSVNFIREREANSKLTAKLKRALEQQSSAAGRMRTIQYTLRVNHQTWEEWNPDVKVVLGQIILHVLMESTDLFETETREVHTSSYF